MTDGQSGCTCHLEQFFSDCESYRSDSLKYTVIDAECVEVCYTDSEDYAALIASALCHFDNGPECGACRVHDRAFYQKKLDAEDGDTYEKEPEDSLSFLIDRLLHATVDHGNSTQFLRRYFRREIVPYMREDQSRK